jgi:hypothetical protein
MWISTNVTNIYLASIRFGTLQYLYTTCTIYPTYVIDTSDLSTHWQSLLAQSMIEAAELK